MSVCALHIRPFLHIVQWPVWRKQLKQQTGFLEGQDVPEGFTVMRTSPCSFMRTSLCLSQGFAVQSTSAPWLRSSPDQQERETSNNEATITPWHCPELERQSGSQEDKLLWGHSGNMMWPWEGRNVPEQACLFISQQSRLFSDFRGSQIYTASQMPTT